MRKSIFRKTILACAIAVTLSGCGSKAEDKTTETTVTEVVDNQPEETTESASSTIEVKETDSNQELDIETTEKEETTEVELNLDSDTWMGAYASFLMNKSSFEDWLSQGSSYSDMAVEASFISGFTILDLTGDDVPELIILAQPGWNSNVNEKLIVYAFNSDTKKVELLKTVTSCGHSKESVGKMDIEIDELCNPYDCVAGIDSEGNLITFYNSFDIFVTWHMSKVDVSKPIGEDNEILYMEDFDFSTGAKQYSDGDEEAAKKILDEYKPIMFFEINSENIKKYVVEDYKNLDMLGFTREEVIGYLQNKSDAYCGIDKSTIQPDGVIDGAGISYNLEYLMQWQSK